MRFSNPEKEQSVYAYSAEIMEPPDTDEITSTLLKIFRSCNARRHPK